VVFSIEDGLLNQQTQNARIWQWASLYC